MTVCEKHGTALKAVPYGVGSFAKQKLVCYECSDEDRAIEAEKEKNDFLRGKQSRVEKVLNGEFGNIPLRFRDATISDFGGARYDKNSLIFLTGKCGTGKTRLAVALMKEYALAAIEKDEYPTVKFFNFQDIAIKVKSSFGDNYSDSMEQIISECRKCDFAVIDDICTARPSPTEIDALYLVVNHRYENMLPTVYTTNLNIKELAGIYGDRISSRLSSCVRVDMPGTDRRINRAA